MKKYKSADLTHKRAEVFREAEANGVIIQQCRTNGEVISGLVLMSKSQCDCLVSASRGTLGVGDYYEAKNQMVG